MTSKSAVRGVWCATLTPIGGAGHLDHGRLAAHVRQLLASGVDGVALFGTTGEGQSFSVAERRDALDALVTAGIDVARILVGTACVSTPETILLTRHAIERGCAGALVLPPFFYKDVSDEGVFASYARIIEGVAEDKLRLYPYHIPQTTAVSITHKLIARLAAAYPSAIVGIKDSSCNLAHEQALLRRFPNLDILVGFEPHLPAALAAGAAGTICGIANLYPRLIRRLHDCTDESERRIDLDRIHALIALLDRYPLIASFKAIKALLANDDGWLALRAPLVEMSRASRRALIAELGATGIDPARDGAQSL
jgi:4-hydroxy-tetrahydrodipicolinate synthase